MKSQVCLSYFLLVRAVVKGNSGKYFGSFRMTFIEILVNNYFIVFLKRHVFSNDLDTAEKTKRPSSINTAMGVGTRKR